MVGHLEEDETPSVLNKIMPPSIFDHNNIDLSRDTRLPGFQDKINSLNLGL